jgi:hypothetical protein
MRFCTRRGCRRSSARTSSTRTKSLGSFGGAKPDRMIARPGFDAGRFPEKVTAFREGITVHSRYRLPCPACGSPVQHRLRRKRNQLLPDLSNWRKAPGGPGARLLKSVASQS